MIALTHLELAIERRRLLHDVDAQIERGEFVALLGPNGVGKTTLLRTIAGLTRPAEGTVTIDGCDVMALSVQQRARRLAFVTGDEVLLDGLRVRDVVAMGRFAHHRWWQWRERDDDVKAVTEALAAVGLEAFATRLLATLSTGERQRVWIALGLAQQTPVLLLDEPTSHLDLRVAHEILALLKRLAREGKTVICAIHDVNDAAAYADRIALLGNGRLAIVDRPDVVLTGGLIESVYGVTMERVALDDGTLRVFARDVAAGSTERTSDPSTHRA
ncbi:MAG TPA: ABC transporter ATP-binding protein [Candidatus Baltobacteraceae bacterium]|nr:ABC transporter ATP-binding protein [Candidatus Baltobacteraceae bacterium]